MKTIYLRTAYTLLLFWFCWISREVSSVQPLAAAGIFPVLLFASFRPFHAATRAAAFAAALYAHYLIFSTGMTGHSHHAWPLAAFALIFVSGAGARFTEEDVRAIRGAQALLLAPYFLSGLWRLHSALQVPFRGLGHALLIFPSESLAYAMAEGNGPTQAMREILLGAPWLGVAGFLGFWIFELTAIVPVMKPKFTFIWGITAVVFHISTGFALSVWFYPMILSSLFFLVLTEEFLKLDKAAE